MFIFQVIGYKNSGKTTLVSKLITHFSDIGMKVASLKHHGHGGPPSELTNTDSFKHRQAGAVLAGVEGSGLLQLSIHQASWDMDQIMKFYHMMNNDVLVIEGFKKEDFFKIIIVRSEDDLRLLNQLSNIQAVVTSLDLSAEEVSVPIFKLDDFDRLSKWLENQIISWGE
jgi:molybdopterin-guanine dinucleotide biosynthesis adapter protein